MAEKDKPTAAETADAEEKAFARRAARAELDAARIEDERREALNASEAANYATALGEPVKAEKTEG